MPAALRRAGRQAGEFAANWGAPITMGLVTAAIVWTIWYYSKVPCTSLAAANGLCNPAAVARYINVEILLQSGGAALAVGALKGSYDRNMLKREREARQHAEERLAEEREKNAAALEKNAAALQEYLKAARQANESAKQANEAHQAALQRAGEAQQEAGEAQQQTIEAQQRVIEVQQRAIDAQESENRLTVELIGELREERRQNAAVQQAILDAVLRLAAGGRNGSPGPESGDA